MMTMQKQKFQTENFKNFSQEFMTLNMKSFLKDLRMWGPCSIVQEDIQGLTTLFSISIFGLVSGFVTLKTILTC